MLRLEAGDAVLEIDAAGGRMSRLALAGIDLLVGRADDPIGWGCYPMVPWAGRVGNARFAFGGTDYALVPNLPPHAIHGTTLRRRWEVQDDATLRCDLGSGWPFGGHAIQHFELHADSLTVELEVHARDEPFPATLGWHPWFRRSIRGCDAQLSFTAGRMYERGPDHLPTGRLVAPTPGPWDDAFTAITEAPTIAWGDAIELSIETDLDHLVVYDEPAHALCIEPQSGPPDPFALDLARVVTPDRPLTGRMRWTWMRG